MITVNNIKFTSYYEMCKHFNIEFNELLQYKKENSHISEHELLNHFFPGIKFKLSNYSYYTSE